MILEVRSAVRALDAVFAEKTPDWSSTLMSAEWIEGRYRVGRRRCWSRSRRWWYCRIIQGILRNWEGDVFARYRSHCADEIVGWSPLAFQAGACFSLSKEGSRFGGVLYFSCYMSTRNRAFVKHAIGSRLCSPLREAFLENET